MLRYVIALFAVLSVSIAAPAHAIFFNDSNVIEVEDGVPPNVVTGGTPIFGGGGGNSGGTSGEVNTGHDFSAGEEEEVGPGTGTTGGGNGIASLPQSTLQTLQSVLEALLKNGVFAGSSFGVLGFLSSIDISSSNGKPMTIAELLREGTWEIDGDAVRSALRGNIDLRSVLAEYTPDWSSADGRIYGFMAAKAAISDRNIAKIAFTATAFEIRYRSRGYLFGLFPMSFPVVVRVVPVAESLESRISVKLPWYRFFVRELFTANGLRADIDEVLKTEMAQVATNVTDPNVILFGAVTKYLKSKIGTLADTVAQ